MRWSLLATLVVGLAGCPDPHEDFDDFVKRVGALDMASTEPDAAPSRIADITGTFLLALAANLSPANPLQFLLTSTLTPIGDGTGTLDVVVQPLSTPDREAVGASSTYDGTPVAADGTFRLELGRTTVPGAANPITGSDITAELALLATIRSANRYCGEVEGKVVSPIMHDLKGSKWGAIRVPPGTIGKALPPPDSTCPSEEPPDGGGTD